MLAPDRPGRLPWIWCVLGVLAVLIGWATSADAQTVTTTLPDRPAGLALEAEASGERLMTCVSAASLAGMMLAQDPPPPTSTTTTSPPPPAEVTVTNTPSVQVVGLSMDCAAESVSRWLRVIVGLLGVLVAIQTAGFVRPWLTRERV